MLVPWYLGCKHPWELALRAKATLLSRSFQFSKAVMFCKEDRVSKKSRGNCEEDSISNELEEDSS